MYDAPGKLKTPGVMVVIKLLSKRILIFVALVKLNALEGTIAILLSFKKTKTNIALGKIKGAVIDVILLEPR